MLQAVMHKVQISSSWEQLPEQQDDSAKSLMRMTSQMIQQEPNVRV